MNIAKSIFFSGIFTFAVLFANAQSAAHLKHHHPLPLRLCGVKAGYTTDSAVVQLYGEGLFDSKDGHGARYYSDEAKKMILKTTIGKDNIIEEVAVCSYKLPFDGIKDRLMSVPASKKLNAGAIILGNLHLGDPKERIVQLFGAPNKMESVKGINTRLLIYEDTKDEWKEVTSYRATYEFKDERLERIKIYNGE